ncbi:glycosyltransferase family 58 protein [Cylindrobasidium torrendii FP15055 ss-10]|uniref:Dol-P-Man:Man(5)GlcNAc(2)-PP-Dol alpha-1,3-mannosyltransferase n=1 Tax=Cylindrobasidium torrendii FP15055 ss-10 TaxID=1314674 RepID=A0A0D7B1R4_9AGAR|nr:glycosyltransferase family 58 protein [Cylindrobasidium torrendii FP15055 ss-10]
MNAIGLMSILASFVHYLLFDRRSFKLVAALVILGDVILTGAIIHYVPYTEIDWVTYMAQISAYMKGERNYSHISGPTGPLVYPAGHVLIHQLLYPIGDNISVVQDIYGGLYILTLIVTVGIYYRGGAPNVLLLALPLSKRLHSIFALRLFNDCWAILLMQSSVLAIQLRWDILGAALFSAALSVKMNIILYLPALLVILVKRRGIYRAIPPLAVVAAVQLAVAYPFRYFLKEYLAGAFDLSRIFLYKWTVNWRMISEETFLSREWHTTLLLGQVVTLVVFGWRWIGGWKVIEKAAKRPTRAPGLGPDEDVALMLFTSNLIGIIFSRSLHYQFYSWYAQQLPYIAWRTRWHWSLKILFVLMIEYAWNVFPSTPLSSNLLLGANVALLSGLWL